MTAATSYAHSAVEAGADNLAVSQLDQARLHFTRQKIKRTIPVIQEIRKYREALPQIPIERGLSSIFPGLAEERILD